MNLLDRSARNAKERQRGQNMNSHIDEMIAAHGEAAGGIVDCEGKIENGPAACGVSEGRREDWTQRPKMPDAAILHDPRTVIENKGAVETIGVHRQHGDDEKTARQRNPVR